MVHMRTTKKQPPEPDPKRIRLISSGGAGEADPSSGEEGVGAAGGLGAATAWGRVNVRWF